jgi:hypothetical protein
MCGASLKSLIAVVALTGVLSVREARAQLPAIPITFRPVHDPALTFSAEVTYGKGFSGISELDALGGWITLESERFRAAAGVASLMPDGGGNKAAGAVKLGYRFSGLLTLFPFVSQVGLGFFELEQTGAELEQMDIPLGVAVGLAGLLPMQYVSNVEPWIGGSVVMRRTKVTTTLADDSAFRGGAALSLGVNVGLPVGIGFHVEGQFARMREPFLSEWSGESTLGFGAFFRY